MDTLNKSVTAANDARRVTVCAECKRASCWQGSMMCEGYRQAGSKDLSVGELRLLARESPHYWEKA